VFDIECILPCRCWPTRWVISWSKEVGCFLTSTNSAGLTEWLVSFLGHIHGDLRRKGSRKLLGKRGTSSALCMLLCVLWILQTFSCFKLYGHMCDTVQYRNLHHMLRADRQPGWFSGLNPSLCKHWWGPGNSELFILTCAYAVLRLWTNSTRVVVFLDSLRYMFILDDDIYGTSVAYLMLL